MIYSCLIKDFEARPSAKDLLQHPFITSLPTDKSMVCLCIMGEGLERGRVGERGEIIKKDQTTSITDISMICLDL